jgi:hypothetical protein
VARSPETEERELSEALLRSPVCASFTASERALTCVESEVTEAVLALVARPVVTSST